MRLNNEQFLLAAVFTSGFLLGTIFLEFLALEFDRTISLSDILSMVLTAIVGIYLGVTISKRQSSNRFEKDFLISDMNKVTEYMDGNAIFKSTVDIKHSEAKASFKELNIRISNFENIIGSAVHCSGLELKELRDAFSNYRASILDLNPIGGSIKPTILERKNIMEKYREFRKETFKVILAINSY